MTDTQNLENAAASLDNATKKDWSGYFVPKHTAKLIKAGIENNTAPFIPVNGQINTAPVYNANTGYVLDAKDLLPVKLTQAEKGYAGNVVGTFNTMEKAHTRIRKGEHGVWFNFKGQDGELHPAAYFFGEQTEQPERFAEFAKQVKIKGQTLAQQNFVIKPDSPSVSDYLTAYMVACKSGAKLEVSPEVAEKFKQNMMVLCNNELACGKDKKNPEIPTLSNVLYNADRKANELVKSAEKSLGIEKKAPEKKQERKQARAMER